MAMGDGGARLGGLNRGGGDLLGSARHMRRPILRAAAAGNGAGDEDVFGHFEGHRANPSLLFSERVAPEILSCDT